MKFNDYVYNISVQDDESYIVNQVAVHNCGLPVVATDVGSLRMIMDSMWIVPTYPENIVIKDMSNRLNLYASYSYNLRWQK
jgi:hypothetical protein